jgi:hypothetical protein
VIELARAAEAHRGFDLIGVAPLEPITAEVFRKQRMRGEGRRLVAPLEAWPLRAHAVARRALKG